MIKQCKKSIYEFLAQYDRQKFLPKFLKYQNHGLLQKPGLEEYLKLEKKRRNLELTDIEKLAEDIPKLFTFEEYIHNDFYYNALQIKKYAGLPEDFIIKATIEHGVYIDFLWEQDVFAPFSSIIVGSQYRKDFLENANIEKKIYKLGPFIAYVEPNLSQRDIVKEKQRLGKNLLFFPAHSSHWVFSKFDVNNIIIHLKEITKDFDTVRVCLYWKDILQGLAIEFQKAGFECVCAGHIYDPNFLPRLRTLLEIADVTVSNKEGTHIAYSLALGKPHYIINDTIEFDSDYPEYKKEIKHSYEQIQYKETINTLFGTLSENITHEQKAFADYYYGVNESKNKEEIKDILLEMHKRG